MLSTAHKNLLLGLARENTRTMRDSLRLARAALGDEHMTVRILTKRVENAEAAERALESEPARQVA
jgi:hypothetical protein